MSINYYYNQHHQARSGAAKVISFTYPILQLGAIILISFTIAAMFALTAEGNEPGLKQGSVTSTKTIAATAEMDSALTDSIPGIDEFIPVDQPPKLIYQHPPVYPAIAENAGLTGRVYMKALIDEDGKIIKSVVYKSSGFSWLDDAALDAAFMNKFLPAMRSGEPVKYWATYKVDFILGD